jgi:hypothetical protein
MVRYFAKEWIGESFNLFGTWSLNLLSLEVVALLVCFILYLPFLIGDRRKAAAASA